MSSASEPFLAPHEKEQDSLSQDDHLALRVVEEDTGLFPPTPLRRHCRPSDSITSLLFRSLTISLALWGILALLTIAIYDPLIIFHLSTPVDVFHPSTLPPGANECDCGTTLASALAKGCKYDSLASAWLPAACRDDELTADFEKAGTEPDGSWPYFADKEGTRRINLDEVASLGPMGGVFWTTREWHIAHCMFYWRKLYRMRDTGAIMEKRFDGEMHVMHCGKLAMKDKPQKFFLVDVPVQMNSAVSQDPKKLPGMHHMLGEGR